MGCNIHIKVEIKKTNKWYQESCLNPFDYRSYGLYGFLANVRNYSEVPFIQESRGIPQDSPSYGKDLDYESLGEHNFGYIILKELLDFDYDKTFQDMRTSETVGNLTNGAARSKIVGVTITFKEFLGEHYFNQLKILKRSIDNPEDLRIIFGFDS